jgi:hypothetical protein
MHRIGIELYTSLMTFKTFSTIQWSSIYDWLFATVMHVPRIVCVWYSAVMASVNNKWQNFCFIWLQQSFENGYGLTSDSLLNRHYFKFLFFDFKILLAIIFIFIISDENVNQVFSQIHVRVAYLFLYLRSRYICYRKRAVTVPYRTVC